MADGFIKLHRQLLESYVFANPVSLKIWIWCLCKANFKKSFASIKIGNGYSTVEVNAGQFIFGRFKAEEELGINGSTVYKHIQKLEQEGMIIIESNSHYTVV